MFKGFLAFIARGNVVDLAVAVIVGAAFNAIVTALVKDLLTPLVAAVFGKPDFSTLAFTVNHSRFAVGDFLNAIISFLLVSAAVYYGVVLPMNALAARRNAGKSVAPTTKVCPECLSVIPVGAHRCAFCTSALSG